MSRQDGGERRGRWALLQIWAPDLPEIAKRHGGQFPDDKMYQIIDGRVPIKAHGTRDMPVWGIELWRAQGYDLEAGRKATLAIESWSTT